MKITHFSYNAFLIEGDDAKIAIDPGQNLALFKLESLIPRSEWATITHILVTHGDPDHYWQADRVQAESHAPLVCGKALAKCKDGRTLLVGPRSRGLSGWMPFEDVHPLDVGESVTLGRVEVEAVRSEHGPIAIPILWFELKQQPGPEERVGLGSMGFKITLGDKTLTNLGDSILLNDWNDLETDVLMLPIGGGGDGKWTMDVTEALEAVRRISPKLVIPCHYNVPFLWIRDIAAADDQRFRREVEAMGIDCRIMGSGESIRV